MAPLINDVPISIPTNDKITFLSRVYVLHQEANGYAIMKRILLKAKVAL